MTDKELQEAAYPGIRSRLESYSTPEARRMYVEERDAGHLYNHYLEHVQLLLWEVDRLQGKLEAQHAATPARGDGEAAWNHLLKESPWVANDDYYKKNPTKSYTYNAFLAGISHARASPLGAEEAAKLETLLRRLLNKVNVVTCFHRHYPHQVPGGALTDLSERQILIEEELRKLKSEGGVEREGK